MSMKTETKETLDLAEFAKEVHQVAATHGWWDIPHKTPLECHMLIVSEVAEASEEVRKGTPPMYIPLNDGDKLTPDNPLWSNSYTHMKTEGEAVELADAVLRILDYCEFHKLPLIKALKAKNEYNKTRSYKHGKKL